MKVRCYRNLTNGKISIQDIKTKLVIGYADEICMIDCECKVYDKGRDMVIKTSTKNLHAYIIGTITHCKGFVLRCRNKDRFYALLDLIQDEGDYIDYDRIITYNPYLYTSFIDVKK
jgi:hypothetical protein